MFLFCPHTTFLLYALFPSELFWCRCCGGVKRLYTKNMRGYIHVYGFVCQEWCICIIIWLTVFWLLLLGRIVACIFFRLMCEWLFLFFFLFLFSLRCLVLYKWCYQENLVLKFASIIKRKSKIYWNLKNRIHWSQNARLYEHKRRLHSTLNRYIFNDSNRNST